MGLVVVLYLALESRLRPGPLRRRCPGRGSPRDDGKKVDAVAPIAEIAATGGSTASRDRRPALGGDRPERSWRRSAPMSSRARRVALAMARAGQFPSVRRACHVERGAPAAATALPRSGGRWSCSGRRRSSQILRYCRGSGSRCSRSLSVGSVSMCSDTSPARTPQAVPDARLSGDPGRLPLGRKRPGRGRRSRRLETGRLFGREHPGGHPPVLPRPGPDPPG